MNLTILIIACILVPVLIGIWVLIKAVRINLDTELYEGWLYMIYSRHHSNPQVEYDILNKLKEGLPVQDAIFDVFEGLAWRRTDTIFRLLAGHQCKMTRSIIAEKVMTSSYYGLVALKMIDKQPNKSLEEEFFSRGK